MSLLESRLPALLAGGFEIGDAVHPWLLVSQLPICQNYCGTAHTHPENPFSPFAVHYLKLRVSPMLPRRGLVNQRPLPVRLEAVHHEAEMFLKQGKRSNGCE